MKPFVKLLSLTTALFLLIGCLPVLSVSAEGEAKVLSVRFVNSEGQVVTETDPDTDVTAQVVLSGAVRTVQAASLYLSATGAEFGTVTTADGFSERDSNLADDGVLAVALYNATGVALTDGVLCSVAIHVGDSPVSVSLNGTEGEEVSTGLADANGDALPLDSLENATIDVVGGAPGFCGAQLVLSSSIGINFYVKDEVLEQAEAVSSYAKVSFDLNRDGDDDELILRPTPDIQTIDGEEVDCQRYFFNGIAPDNMGQTITAQLVYVDAAGEEHPGLSRDYSVTEYITNTYNRNLSNGTLTQLLANLLAYGRAAENYTGQSSITMTETLTALLGQASSDTVADTSLSNKKSLRYESGVTASTAAVQWTTVGLNLRDNAALLYVFKPASGKSISDYTLKLEVEGRETPYTVDGSQIQYEGEYGAYVYRFRELGPCDMSKVVKAYFVDKDDNKVSGTLQYSIESYAYYCYKNKTSNPELCALTQALIRYGNSVQSYVS